MRLRATDDSVEVSVADDGPGWRQRCAPPVQAPAALGARRGDNGGLGLLIVQRIVQLHGRRIELRDSASGALFVFALPRAEPAPSRPVRPSPPPLSSGSFRRMHAPPVRVGHFNVAPC